MSGLTPTYVLLTIVDIVIAADLGSKFNLGTGTRGACPGPLQGSRPGSIRKSRPACRRLELGGRAQTKGVR